MPLSRSRAPSGCGLWLVFSFPYHISVRWYVNIWIQIKGPSPRISSSQIVSDHLHSYNFMSITSFPLSKTLGHVQFPQTILSTVKLITLLQYHRRSSKSFLPTTHSIQPVRLPRTWKYQDHIRLVFLGRPVPSKYFIPYVRSKMAPRRPAEVCPGFIFVKSKSSHYSHNSEYSPKY